jgi:hypothetical protein
MWLAAVLGCAHPVPAAVPAPAAAASPAEDAHPDVVVWCVRGLLARAAGDEAERQRAMGWLDVLGALPGAAACRAELAADPAPAEVLAVPARAEPEAP